ncbi:hypothetical protein [Streptomonospora salina]|uniref:PD-(D/E)XK endonuclease-like domain-containing protein n=1 Tax=Streptomonospora salina TaxID=104205 RepID=A0A841EB57_9ACTN|nr:hypothetical protein [Streptomonospora salina]MBB6000252.1 hypothetical protein [Streptomonospora salina]
MSDPFTTPAEIGSAPDGETALAVGKADPGVGEWLQEVIWSRSAKSPRSLQRRPGPSSLGTECDRQLAYTLTGRRPVNLEADPWAAIVGTAVHTWMANLFDALDGGTGRYLIEYPITYQGVQGTPDLYDRRRRLVVDWKTCKLDKLRTIRKQGPPRGYIVQSQIYAAGLTEAGEDPAATALVFLPVDGRLSDLYVWSAGVEPSIAESALARLNSLEGTAPAKVPAKPSRLCPWCDFYRPGSTDLSVGCPGPSTERKT